MSSKRRARQRGANLMEFGLAFLIIFGLICGILEFGRLVAAYNILAGATREATRYAVVHGSASGSPASTTDVQDVVRKWAIGLDPNLVSVTTTWTPNKAPGAKVRVIAQYNMAPLTGIALGSAVTIGSSSEMVISQ